ncbi:MAG: hypothetical protein KTR31_15730 [Myxococcales bacterium]|nr:hypothetical protein [Myxococcales bacterium]
MSERRSRLAARFRAAVEHEQETKERDAQAAERATQAAAEARTALMGELAALARDIGFLTVRSTRDGLTLRYGERYVHFAPRGEGDVAVEFEGTGDDQHTLYRQPELGHRWVYQRKKRFKEDRIPLFDQGIEELLVIALGLPRPSEPDPDGSGAPPSRSL